MGRRKWILFIGMLLVCTCFILLSGCGSVNTDETYSPNLTGMSISSYNEGSESTQFVEAVLTFDKDVSVSEKNEDSLRIVIGGERIKKDEYKLEQGDDPKQVSLTIPVDYVTTGVLVIEKSENSGTISDIRDGTGEYAVNEFNAEGIIPCGINLSTVSSDGTGVTKQVDSVWNIRSIAWVCLTKNGEPIPVNEPDENEELDGRVAVHGHEFLIEDEGVIAEKIVEELQSVYGSEYEFSSDANRIIMHAEDSEEAEYDIEIYSYVKINGEDALSEDEEQHEGSKVRTPELNREATEEEQAFIDCLHISKLSDEMIKDGTEIYSSLIITGDAMPEEAVYSIKDMEDLIELSFRNNEMNQLGLPQKVETTADEADGKAVYYGLDMVKLLKLSGVDMGKEKLYAAFETADGDREVIDLASLSKEQQLLLVFAKDEEPLHEGQKGVSGPAAALYVTGNKADAINSVERITLSEKKSCKDTEYRFHNREPWSADREKTFTIEVYENDTKHKEPAKTKTFTTEKFEKLMRKNPEHVVGGYYGTIGNEEEFAYIGVGSWLDYFEGLDLRWLLTEYMGIDELSGSAELIGRDGEIYGSIDSLEYLSETYDSEDYYVLNSEGIKIPGAVPMIACTKNGYPILPEHDHESAAYVAYNHFNQQLYQRGINTEIGVVKNHNGPFVACLGNLKGYYGGAEIETGGDCVLMKVYID